MDDLTDHIARDRIRTDLRSSLFVEAGAGSGKTTMLVDRVVALVTNPVEPVPIESIAAITFTEHAAAELRSRIGHALETLVDDPTATTDQRDLAGTARDHLEGAPIGTLHAFALSILRDHALEAGLPPTIAVVDEVDAAVAADLRWATLRDRLLAAEDLGPALAVASAAGISIPRLQALARAFDAQWDLVAERVREPAPTPAPEVKADIFEALARLTSLAPRCTDPTDKLLAVLADLAEAAQHLARLPADDPSALVACLGWFKTIKTRVGRKERWPGVDLTAVRADLDALRARCDEQRAEIIEGAITRIAAAVAASTLAAADARCAAGQLEFTDLLVRARMLLRHPDHGWPTRRALRARYRVLLLDEYQDTDPLQVELAVLLASPDPHPGNTPWFDLPTDAGRLFFVGDPKQSIYRFRRADLRTYLRTSERFNDTVTLSSNFRTAPDVVAWVNALFTHLLAPDPALPDAQPPFTALDAVRSAPPVGPPVSVLGATAHDDGADATEVRRRDAADVAATVCRAVDEQWSVHDDGGWRPARYGDIAILLPARTSLPTLEAALRSADVPYRLETGSLVHASREARDLGNAMAAIADPTDELALLSALRSPLFGCGDDDLADYRITHGGNWDILAPLPSSLPTDHPVAEGITELRRLYHQQWHHSSGELLTMLVDRRRVLEAAHLLGVGAERSARIAFVIESAHEWHREASAKGTDHSVAAWVSRTRRMAGDTRSVDHLPPPPQADAVRILTIHGAKGLEFPITILSGLSTRPNRSGGAVQVVFPPSGGVGYRLGAGATTPLYDETKPIDEQMDHHERLRLLYVGATRARDHLVISLHRGARKGSTDPANLSNAEVLALAGAATAGGVSHCPDPVPPSDPTATDRSPAAAPSADRPAPPRLVRSTHEDAAAANAAGAVVQRWARRSEAIRRANRPASVHPSHLGDLLHTSSEALDHTTHDEHAAARARAIGRAAHAVLETSDLWSSVIDPQADRVTANAFAEAEGVADATDLILAMLAAARSNPEIRGLDPAVTWREVPVVIPAGDSVLEGTVDLVSRTPDGLLIVDWKTGAAPESGPRPGYLLQLGAYAEAMSVATGEPIAGAVLIHLTNDSSTTVTVDDLDRWRSEALRAVATAGV